MHNAFIKYCEDNNIYFGFEYKIPDELFSDYLEAKKQGLIKFHPAGDLFVKQAIFNVSDPEEAAKQWSALLQAEVVSEGDTYTINIGNKQLVFTAGVENRLFKLIFHGAKQPEKLQLGQIRFELTDKE